MCSGEKGDPDASRADAVMIQATSAEQLHAFRSRTIPEPEWVREGTLAIAMPMTTSQLGYSFCYLLDDGSGRLHIVDPGTDTDENEQRLRAACALFGRDAADIATITVTHLHPDHLGLAGRVRAASGAPLIMHEAEERAMRQLPNGALDIEQDAQRWGIPSHRRDEFRGLQVEGAGTGFPVVDVVVSDGDALPVPGHSISVLHTPGHTSGHMCLHDRDRGLMYSGDHVLPTIHSGIGFGLPGQTNPIEEYLSALRRLRALDECEVLPGHEHRFRGLAARCDALAEHHLRRTREVAGFHRDGQTVWQLAERLTWTAGWSHLRGVERYSALRQTEMHRQFVASGAAGPYL